MIFLEIIMIQIGFLLYMHLVSLILHILLIVLPSHTHVFITGTFIKNVFITLLFILFKIHFVYNITFHTFFNSLCSIYQVSYIFLN